MFHPQGVVLRGYQCGTRSIMEVHPVTNMCTKFQVPNAIFRLKTYFGGCFIPRDCSEVLPACHPIDNGSIPRHEHVYEISGS